MNAVQGSASSAGSERAPSASGQPGGGIPYGSYGGSSTYGSYGASGSGNFGSPPASGGAGGGHWSGGNWSGGSNWGEGGQYPPKRRRLRRGMAFGAAGLAIAATAVGSYAAVQGGGSATGHATTSSTTTLTTAQIAAKVDPGLVDVISTLGDQSATAEGTGIVLTSTGEVLTNNHVIDGATSVKVVDIGNGKTYTATVVGYDKTKDVAVLKLQNASGLQTAPLGDSSSVAVGQNVIALGNAEGKGGTPAVATGQVTALNQSITASDEGSSANSEQLTGMIQSNAPIQPGDSGGSLVNSSGQVIGMDTAASSASDSPSSQADTPGASNGGSGDSGTGSSGTTTATQAFSIPINTAVTIAQEIVAGDAPPRPSTSVPPGSSASRSPRPAAARRAAARPAAPVTAASAAPAARATAARATVASAAPAGPATAASASVTAARATVASAAPGAPATVASAAPAAPAPPPRARRSRAPCPVPRPRRPGWPRVT